jgi:hypothetical protein
VNEVFHFSRHSWPIKVALDVETCFGCTEVAATGQSMCLFDKNQVILRLWDTDLVQLIEPSLPDVIIKERILINFC